MSCNGCRVLRKGCSEACVLRQCLRLIDTPEAQGHATLFVAKFFGRAGLMSFISAVPESQRPALFQSLLFESCGRTINPVNGAVGLVWTGNWHLCQAAVETVLRGGTLRPIPIDEDSDVPEAYDVSAGPCAHSAHKGVPSQQLLLPQAPLKRPMASYPVHEGNCEGVPPVPSPLDPTTLELSLTSVAQSDKRRPRRSGTHSEESVTTTCAESGLRAGTAAVSHQRENPDPQQQQPMLLNLFQ